MRRRTAFRLLPLAALLSCGAVTAAEPAPFNAAAAWTAFETLLHERYGYFDRPGIDGDAILVAFADRAKAAPTDPEFIDILQLVARNFADPHFIVGPFDDDDWETIPTASDLYGVFDGSAFRIHEVRHGGDAQAKGVPPGMIVARIDGLAPPVAIAAIMGRRFEDLRPAQIEFAFNVALAGRHGKARQLDGTVAGRSRAFLLAATRDQARRVRDGALLDIERRGRLGIIRINNSLGQPALIAQFSQALATLADTDALLIDLRATPSGGNTSVARGIMGHFVDTDRPYQLHVIPYEARVLGPARKFVEYVAPFGTRYRGKLHVAGGRWTGSMGEGMMLGFAAIGASTIGSDLGDLLGGLSNEQIAGSAARIDLGTEQLFSITGQPRAEWRPQRHLPRAERSATHDPVLAQIAP